MADLGYIAAIRRHIMPRTRSVSDMRIWLSHWEWGCCGEPFGVGDTVTLGVLRRVDDWLISSLGSDLADTVDGVEMHHEEEPLPQLIGVVRSIQAARRTYDESNRVPGSVLLSPGVRVPRRIDDPEASPQGSYVRRPFGYLVDLDVLR